MGAEAHQHASRHHPGKQVEHRTDGEGFQCMGVVTFYLADLVGQFGEANPARERGELHQVKVLADDGLPRVSEPLWQKNVAKQTL